MPNFEELEAPLDQFLKLKMISKFNFVVRNSKCYCGIRNPYHKSFEEFLLGNL